MLKRRYRSASDDEHLRRLDYFNQPFVIGNDIKLIDDIDGECKALESIANSFSSVENNPAPKKERHINKSAIIDAEIEDSDSFTDFDFNHTINY
jgi:hypothetical protein